MKNHIKLLIALLPLFVAPMAVNASENPDDLALEPCINGAVSKSGLFTSQELEDAYRSSVSAAARSLAPRINGAVSATGTPPREDTGQNRFAYDQSNSARSL